MIQLTMTVGIIAMKMALHRVMEPLVYAKWDIMELIVTEVFL